MQELIRIVTDLLTENPIGTIVFIGVAYWIWNGAIRKGPRG